MNGKENVDLDTLKFELREDKKEISFSMNDDGNLIMIASVSRKKVEDN